MREMGPSFVTVAAQGFYRSRVRNCYPLPESPDFLRNQDFFRTFLPNNLLAVFSDPNADPNGSG